MGLDDKDRISGIFYSIKSITNLGKELRDLKKTDNISYQDFEILCSLIDELWPATIGNGRNRNHWLGGSSATQAISYNSSTVWGIAIKEMIENEIRAMNDQTNIDWDNLSFDPFDNILNISGLLPKPYSQIHQIFAWSEQLIYYLRYYVDGLLSNLKGLSDLVAKIHGECFSIFSSEESEEIYTKAYLVHRIAEAIYDDRQGWFYDWLIEENFHHKLSRPVIGDRDPTPIKDLIRTHHRIIKARIAYNRDEKKKPYYDLIRVISALELAGRKFFYDRDHKKLISLLLDNNWPNVFIDMVVQSLNKCKDARKAYEAEQKAELSDQDLTGTEIYYEYYF